MKKLLAILLAAMMLLSLSACGNDSNTDPNKDTPGVSQTNDNGDESTDDNQRGSDNSDEPSNADDSGDVSSGEEFEWKNNDLTAGVPEPNFGVMTGSIEMPLFNTYTAKYMEVTDAEIIDYIGKLKAAGWNGEQSGESANITFRASADDGRSLGIEYRQGLVTMTFSKEE